MSNAGNAPVNLISPTTVSGSGTVMGAGGGAQNGNGLSVPNTGGFAGFDTPLVDEPSFGQNPDPNNNSTGANQYAAQLGAIGQGFLNQQGPNPYANAYGQQATTDLGAASSAAGAYGSQLSALAAAASGQSANPADAVLSAGGAQSQAQQIALARSGGVGGAGALAARQALANNAATGINTANQTAQANQAYQASSAQALQGASANYANQQQQLQQNQQATAVNTGQLQQTQQNQNAANQLAMATQGVGVETGQLAANSNVYDAGQSNATNIQAAQNAAANQQNNSLIQGGMGLGSAAIGLLMSDVRLKHDVESEGERHSQADEFLSSLRPYSYEYDRPQDAPSLANPGGRHLGVMAQDVERTALGSRLIARRSDGAKAIQVAPAMSAALAGIGRLHERVAMLERQSRGDK